jgi:hypothetical protein
MPTIRPTTLVYNVQPSLTSSFQACSKPTASTGRLRLRHLPHWASKEPPESRRREEGGEVLNERAESFTLWSSILVLKHTWKSTRAFGLSLVKISCGFMFTMTSVMFGRKIRSPHVLAN